MRTLWARRTFLRSCISGVSIARRAVSNRRVGDVAGQLPVRGSSRRASARHGVRFTSGKHTGFGRGHLVSVTPGIEGWPAKLTHTCLPVLRH